MISALTSIIPDPGWSDHPGSDITPSRKPKLKKPQVLGCMESEMMLNLQITLYLFTYFFILNYLFQE